MQTQLYLTPVDTFFFRNHMSMNAGEDSAAMGLFPPRPGTVYGALRSAYIHQHSTFSAFRDGADESVKDWMGTPTQIGSFRLQGVFVHTGTHLLLPLPLDHEIVSDDKGETAHRLVLDPINSDASERQQHLLIGTQPMKTHSPDSGYVVEAESWKRTILGQRLLSVRKVSEWMMTEPKIGIARDAKTGRAQDHMLYEMDMLRLVGDRSNAGAAPSLCVFASQAPDFGEVRVLSMGAEQRPWHLRQQTGEMFELSEEERAQLVAGIAESGCARLILLSPTIWEQTWNHERQTLHLGNLELPILAQAIGRPQLIGGWDLHRNRPKPRSWALAPGSVFYVEVANHQAEAFVQATLLQNHSDQLVHEGYGLMMPALV